MAPDMGLAVPGAKVEAGYREWFRRRMIASPLVIGGKAEYSALRNARQPCPRTGDVLTVTGLDRLARSTFDLFGIVKRIVDAKAQFRSLAEPWSDTGTSTGRLMLAVLGGLADVEHDLIRTRTAEGRSRAKEQGKAMGRPPTLTPAHQTEATGRRARGATLKELAKSYNVGISTIRRATRTT